MSKLGLVQKGRAACNAPLLNKETLERAVLDQIQDQILTEDNVRPYLQLVLQPVRQSQATPSAEAQALELTIKDVETRIRRWKDTLERGLLSLEEAAHRIKELRAGRDALLKKKIVLEKKSPLERLRETKLGAKKEFLREIVKEVRVRDKTIQMTYKLPLAPRTSPSQERKSPGEESS